MNLKSILRVTAILSLVAQPAQSQVGTFTQVGRVSCAFGSCPPVTFPVAYAVAPQVVVAFSRVYTYPSSNDNGPPFAQAYVYPTNVTRSGFNIGFDGTSNGADQVVSWVAVGPEAFTGTVLVRYLVLTVIYAPPGTNGGHSSSAVTYASGSSAGTLTSATDSFKQANALSVDFSGGVLGEGGGAGLSFDWSHSSTDNQSLEVKKSITSTITRTGPAQDGVNHDEDAIYLLLNPSVNLTVSSVSAEWLPANSPSRIQYVYVGWLNGHVAMPADVAATLRSAGITPRDYPDILAQDPFANGSTAIDPARFQSLNTTFPYEPPYAATDPVPTITTNISTSTLQTSSSTIDDTYKVGLSMSQTGSFFDLMTAKLKEGATWEWTNRASVTTSSGLSQSATVTVGGPAYGYAGPTILEVYFDNIYRTFAFVVAEPPHGAVVGGAIRDGKGKRLAATEVVIVQDGIQHRTFTNGAGEYACVRSGKGPVTVRAGSVVRRIDDLRRSSAVDLTLR